MAQTALTFGFGWLAAYVLAHVALMSLARPRLYFVPTARLFLAWLMGGALLAWGRGMPLTTIGIGLLVFVSGWVFYMVATFNVMRSVSIRTMTELVRAPAHALTSVELARLYDVRSMFDRRIDSLVANGYLRQERDHFFLTAKGRAVAQLARLARGAFNLHTYG